MDGQRIEEQFGDEVLLLTETADDDEDYLIPGKLANMILTHASENQGEIASEKNLAEEQQLHAEVTQMCGTHEARGRGAWR